jgi:hypothetical protein
VSAPADTPPPGTLALCGRFHAEATLAGRRELWQVLGDLRLPFADGLPLVQREGGSELGLVQAGRAAPRADELAQEVAAGRFPLLFDAGAPTRAEALLALEWLRSRGASPSAWIETGGTSDTALYDPASDRYLFDLLWHHGVRHLGLAHHRRAAPAFGVRMEDDGAIPMLLEREPVPSGHVVVCFRRVPTASLAELARVLDPRALATLGRTGAALVVELPQVASEGLARFRPILEQVAALRDHQALRVEPLLEVIGRTHCGWVRGTPSPLSAR